MTHADVRAASVSVCLRAAGQMQQCCSAVLRSTAMLQVCRPLCAAPTCWKLEEEACRPGVSMKVMSTPNFLPLSTLTPRVLSLYALVRLLLRPRMALMKADLPVPVMPTTISFTLSPSLRGEGGTEGG